MLWSHSAEHGSSAEPSHGTWTVLLAPYRVPENDHITISLRLFTTLCITSFPCEKYNRLVLYVESAVTRR